jgi:hypothetical protein
MAQQTAMQKLIEDIRNDNDICFLNDGHIEYYFAMEKEQIKDAYWNGTTEMEKQDALIEAEYFYNETYKK